MKGLFPFTLYTFIGQFIMTFEDDFYIINSTSYIKSVPTRLDKDFKKDLIEDNGDLKPHVEKIIPFVFSDGKQCIKATIPICFVEIEYKTRDKDTYLITHEEYLYGDNMPDIESLKAYQKATSYGFASQYSQEIKDLIEAFHMGYGCECLSSGDY